MRFRVVERTWFEGMKVVRYLSLVDYWGDTWYKRVELWHYTSEDEEATP